MSERDVLLNAPAQVPSDRHVGRDPILTNRPFGRSWHYGRVNLIKGMFFSGYRSFSSDQRAVLAPLSKVNLIAGQNNSGKSNVLRIVEGLMAKPSAPENWDRPLFDSEHRRTGFVGYSIDEVIANIKPRSNVHRFEPMLRTFLERLGEISGSPENLVWLSPGNRDESSAIYASWTVDIGNRGLCQELSQALNGGYTNVASEDAHSVLMHLGSKMPKLPPAYRVEGVREVSKNSDEEPNLNGRNIKRRLLQLQAPSSEQLADKEKFAQIQNFVRSVLDDASITIDVPHDLSTIHVSQDGRTLPIEYVGTGVHEVVILAAAATIVQDSVVCIEEPEVHLHPILQRKLLRYLFESTSNQYFIATHSAHMLDSELGSIFHVARSDGRSTLRFAGSARDRAAVCADLGYRPSDIVQSNAILWVEGPSDRIYLKHWIEKLAPNRFVEGTHYSIMFYGGSLLSELSPLDVEEVEEFISLRALNRFMAVIIDSDRTRQRGTLNLSKRRVIDGLAADKSTGLSWVTAGYTIENYVPEPILLEAIRSAHPSRALDKVPAQERWSNPLSSTRLGFERVSKVAVARKAVEKWEDEWPLDLRRQVGQIVQLIERANSHH